MPTLGYAAKLNREEEKKKKKKEEERGDGSEVRTKARIFSLRKHIFHIFESILLCYKIVRRGNSIYRVLGMG